VLRRIWVERGSGLARTKSCGTLRACRALWQEQSALPSWGIPDTEVDQCGSLLRSDVIR
jgi:hypothetical protein